MRLTLESPTYSTKSTIEVGSDDLTIDEVLNDLVIPMMRAHGYHIVCLEDTGRDYVAGDIDNELARHISNI